MALVSPLFTRPHRRGAAPAGPRRSQPLGWLPRSPRRRLRARERRPLPSGLGHRGLPHGPGDPAGAAAPLPGRGVSLSQVRRLPGGPARGPGLRLLERLAIGRDRPRVVTVRDLPPTGPPASRSDRPALRRGPGFLAARILASAWPFCPPIARTSSPGTPIRRFSGAATAQATQRLADLVPVLRRPLVDLLDDYAIDLLLLDREYFPPQALALADRWMEVREFGPYAVFERRFSASSR